MTETEINRILRDKYGNRDAWASQSPAARRKVKLRMRFAGRIDAEIERTEEKLRMLREIKNEP